MRGCSHGRVDAILYYAMMFTNSKHESSPSGFWCGGAEALCDAIRAEFEPQLTLLREQLSECGDERRRQSLRAELETIEAAYNSELQRVDWLIF